MIRHSTGCAMLWAAAGDGVPDPCCWHDTCNVLCYTAETGRNKAGVPIVVWPGGKILSAPADPIVVHDPTLWGMYRVRPPAQPIDPATLFSAIKARLPSQETPMPDQPWSVQQQTTTTTITQLVDPEGRVRQSDSDTRDHESSTSDLPEHQAHQLYMALINGDSNHWSAWADLPGVPEHDCADHFNTVHSGRGGIHLANPPQPILVLPYEDEVRHG